MADYRIHLLAGTAAVLTGGACATGALADTSLGWYAAVDGGNGPFTSQTLKVTDVTLTSAGPAATPPLTAGTYALTPDYSARGFARVGYRFTPHMRGELELGARPGTLKGGLGGSDLVDLGRFDKTSIMANLIVDLLPESAIHPFVGVGAGVVRADTRYREPVSLGGHDLVYSVSRDTTLPAGQVLAGASLDVTQRLHFDMTYRYLRTGSSDYALAVSDTHGGVTDTYAAKAQGAMSDHSVTVGFRWTFGAPGRARAVAETRPETRAATPVTLPVASTPVATPRTQPSPVSASPLPAATAAPAQAAVAKAPASQDLNDTADRSSATAPAPRQFTTYFPLGGAGLNATAQSVVVSAAQLAQATPEATVSVDGYADTSGSMAYNLVLSRRRAHAVAEALTDNGVPADAIIVAWHGEGHLAVKTGDGKANARNRRVTIDVHAKGSAKATHKKHRRYRHRRHKS